MGGGIIFCTFLVATLLAIWHMRRNQVLGVTNIMTKGSVIVNILLLY